MKQIHKKTFFWKGNDNSLIYEVEFTQGNPLKYTHLGKTYAKKTECIIKSNDFILAVNSVTKHAKDKDDNLYAFMNAFRPISKKLPKDVRSDINKQILEYVRIY